jgi:hypothetical protein
VLAFIGTGFPFGPRSESPKNNKAGLVDPAFRFGTGSVDFISISRPSMSKSLNF